MKKSLMVFAVTLFAASAHAQMQIVTTPVYRGATDRGGFSIGPRYSNYATDLDIGIDTIESGRQHAFGLVGDYRSGVFVLDFNWDHDPENGLQFTDLLPIDFGRYERDRAEFTVGWSALPVLDLQAGFRTDTFSVGSGDFFGGDDFDHSAIVFGVNVHTPTRKPFGVYGKARAFVGSVDFGGNSFQGQVDSEGIRLEGGVEIPIGDSNWHAVPGIEIERLEADPRVNVDTNRFFVNFVYSFQR